MVTARRLRKPIRNQTWATDQMSQAMKPLSLKLAHVDDGPASADRRKVAEVTVMEISGAAAQDQVGDKAALLLRDWCDAWQTAALQALRRLQCRRSQKCSDARDA